MFPSTGKDETLSRMRECTCEDEVMRARIARRAFESYRDQIAGLDGRFESVIAEIAGKEQ